MTSTINFDPRLIIGADTVIFSDSPVSSLLWGPIGIETPDTLLLANVLQSNTAGGVPVAPTITDDQGLTWTLLGGVTYDATNGTRNEVYWARCPNRGQITITVSMSGTPSLSSLTVAQIPGGHLTSPKDPNANALKTESHTSAAASGVTGFSTDEAETIIFAFYGSRTNATNVAAPAGFSTMFQQQSSLRTKVFYQQVTSAQSAISVATATSSATGSMIVVAIRPRKTTDALRKGIHWVQGFDQYLTPAQISNFFGDLNTPSQENQISDPIIADDSFVVGRDGIGQALRLIGNFLDGAIMRCTNTLALGFWVRGGGVEVAHGTGNGDTLIDGDHIYIGLNVKVGIFQGVNNHAQGGGWNAVFGIGTGSADTIVFFVNDDPLAPKIGWTLNATTSSSTSPTEAGPPDNIVSIDWDIWQKWCWFEFHLYRHPTDGRFELFMEADEPINSQSGTPAVDPDNGGHGTSKNKARRAGGHKHRHRVHKDNDDDDHDGHDDHPENKPDFKLTTLADFTGDTSVATLGALDVFILYGDNVGANNAQFGCDFDDLIFSTQDRMRGPCYVKGDAPGATADDASCVGFTASVGSSLFACVDDRLNDDNALADYIYGSAQPMKALFQSPGGIGYTPRFTHAVVTQMQIRAVSNAVFCEALIKSGTKTLRGYLWHTITTSDTYLMAIANYDPNTRASWGYADAQAALVGMQIPATVTQQATANTVADEQRMSIIKKYYVVSIEKGTGTPGTPDEPDDPGTVGGDSDRVAVFTCSFLPLEEGVSRGLQADFHPIEKGILI